MKKLFGLVIVALLLAGCIGSQPKANQTDGTLNTTNVTSPQPLTKELCESARGHWDECGSACRDDPNARICTMNCVQYCYCGGIAGFGCPSGYECTDYLPKGADDAMGICTPK